MIIIAKVKTGSSQDKIVLSSAQESDIVVYVREKPRDGLANRRVIQLLSKHYSVPKTQIKLIRGQKSKLKTFSILE